MNGTVGRSVVALFANCVDIAGSKTPPILWVSDGRCSVSLLEPRVYSGVQKKRGRGKKKKKKKGWEGGDSNPIPPKSKKNCLAHLCEACHP